MASFLDSLTSLFGGGSKGQSILGIDVGSSSIKVVQLRRERGVAVLETYGELALGPYSGVEIGRATSLSSEKLGGALIDVIREANVTSKNAGLAIPFSSSLVSVIKMPAVDEDQLKGMVPIEARKYIPVPIAEVTLDWFVVPDSVEIGAAPNAPGAPVKRVDVLLAAIHNETIAKYKSIVAAAGIVASFLEIEIFSTVRAALDHGVAPVVVIDFGAATTKVYIVERGIVRESHIVNRGSQDITNAMAKTLSLSTARAEELKRSEGLQGTSNKQVAEAAMLTLDYIFSEINRVILTYEQRSSKNVSRVVLAGGGAALKGLLSFAQGRLSVDATLADPFGKTQAPAFLLDVLKEAGPIFTVATGVALRKLQENE